MFRTLSIIVLFFICTLIHAFTIDDALKDADELNLHEERYWEILLHYKKGWISYRSLVDDSRFFLSANGQFSKKEELHATIKALTVTPDDPDEHAQCKFPARTAWLKEKLPDLTSLIPQVTCEKYNKIHKKMKPYKATLVFPYYNLSGPASMFGHTMLRIEPPKSTSLLGYAVTYAADATDSGAIDYILKGAFGGFDGKFAVLPYYEKLNEYSAIEFRDVWEYELKLTPEEVDTIFKHIWEISTIYSDYYFFDENCAYNLLFLIESGRDDLVLTDGYFTVLPIDTIRAIDDSNLINNIKFVPSYMKKMLVMADSLSNKGLKTAKKIAVDEFDPAKLAYEDFSDDEKVTILDLASEMVRNNNQQAMDQSSYRRLSISIARTRAQYPVKKDYIVQAPEHAPNTGHLNSKISMGAGYTENTFYGELNYIPSFHSMIDNSIGYLDGDLTVLDTSLRHYDNGKFNINNISLLNVRSLSPVNTLFTKPSWVISGGINDRSLTPERTLMTGYFLAGAGLSVNVTDYGLLWLMVQGEVEGANRYKSWAVAGVGPDAGFQIRFGDVGKLVVKGTYLWYSDAAEHKEGNLTGQFAVYPNINSSIVLNGRLKGYNDKYKSEFGISYNFFF